MGAPADGDQQLVARDFGLIGQRQGERAVLVPADAGRLGAEMELNAPFGQCCGEVLAGKRLLVGEQPAALFDEYHLRAER